MSKTARPARKEPIRKPGAVKLIGRRRPVKKAAKKAVSKKPVSARGPSTRPRAAAERSARPANPVAAKKVPAPRLPADLKLAIAAAQEKQAVDLTVLDLRTASAFTDFFVVCTGNNTRQVQAIADAIETALRESGQKPALVEGYRRGEWILLDYFSFIVHVFLPAQRTFYALERLWGGAEPIEVSAT
jgi:ribosome-associated protein